MQLEGIKRPSINGVEGLQRPSCSEPVTHDQILSKLLDKAEPLDYREIAELGKDETLNAKHFQVITIEQVLSLASKNGWGFCRNHDLIYLYNGAFWSIFNDEEIKSFLGKVAEKMGVEKIKARTWQFRDTLYKQFLTTSYMVKPKLPHDVVLINLRNGTLEITPEKRKLRAFKSSDFLTYQLPFKYDVNAKAVMFEAYLEDVLPDQQRQSVLSEFLGYIFIKTSTLKLEKILLLYGSGANGKSVLFDIISAMLGRENVCSYPLQQLTDTERGGPQRAELANHLVNYSSELSGKMNSDMLKIIASGESLPVRPLYGKPYNIDDYAKSMVNCNDLPKDTESNKGYFRRYLIIPFDKTIPNDQQDKDLAGKIISHELSGVLNWVLQGLDRLLEQRNFSTCKACEEVLTRFEIESDSVKLFLEDGEYSNSLSESMPLKDLYTDYKGYCNNDGYSACSLKTFSKRVRDSGFSIDRRSQGRIIYIEKKVLF